ncbi:hypothetical protein ABH922_004344 [Rhodococcus sp. 27YEA15]
MFVSRIVKAVPSMQSLSCRDGTFEAVERADSSRLRSYGRQPIVGGGAAAGFYSISMCGLVSPGRLRP